MKKKLLRIVAGVCLAGIMLNGCGNTPAATADPSPKNNTQSSPIMENIPAVSEDATFYEALIEFMNKAGFENQNYMISPTSFRAALSLAVSGAEGETREELLKAMGFSSMEEVTSWYESVEASTASFRQWLADENASFEENKDYYPEDAKAPDGAFSLENSIWRNTKATGKLSKDYMAYVKEHFGADAENVAPEKITEKVNTWINEQTNGMIPQISSDLSYADLVLVNTIYLRTSWINEFESYATETGDFTTFSGSTVQKDFMNLQEKLRYYEDENGKFVVLPMNGGIYAVFILGEVQNVIGKMNTASFEEVAVKLPKFETETSLGDNELIAFCKARGANLAFSDKADFSGMSKEMSLMITDIIQKTKIKTDEDGIEAAAATAIVMTETAFMIDEPEIKEFNADQPFTYMILTDSDTPELLFYGQIVE